MDEQKKYEIIKKLVDTDGNKKRASVELMCSVRNVNRMISGYKAKGKEYFIHGNRNRKPIHDSTPKTPYFHNWWLTITNFAIC